MPLQYLGAYESADFSNVQGVIYWASGLQAVGTMFSWLLPPSSYAETGIKQSGKPVIMTPGQTFRQGGVVGIPFTLPGGLTSDNKRFVSDAVSHVPNAKLVGLGPAADGSPEHFVALVSRDASWISVNKISQMFSRLRQRAESGAINAGQAAVDVGQALTKNIQPPKFFFGILDFVWKHPYLVAGGVAAVWFAPTILRTVGSARAAYRQGISSV